MLTSLSYSLPRLVERNFNGGFSRVDLVVSAVTNEGGYLETPIPESFATRSRRCPASGPQRRFACLPGYIFRGVRIALWGGSDGFFDASRYPPIWYLEGDPQTAAAAIRAGRGVNISTSLSDRFAIHVGDDIDLDTPTGRLRLPIVGVVPDFISDRGSVIMNRRLLVDRWRDHALTGFMCSSSRTRLPSRSGTAIRERLGDRYRLKILIAPRSS